MSGTLINEGVQCKDTVCNDTTTYWTKTGHAYLLCVYSIIFIIDNDTVGGDRLAVVCELVTCVDLSSVCLLQPAAVPSSLPRSSPSPPHSSSLSPQTRLGSPDGAQCASPCCYS